MTTGLFYCSRFYCSVVLLFIRFYSLNVFRVILYQLVDELEDSKSSPMLILIINLLGVGEKK